VSAIGALSVSPIDHRLGFYFETLAGGHFGPEQVVAFLRHLLRHLRGKVTVVWDGGSNHKGPVIRKFLARNRRLHLVRLPAYSPALNPVEAVWGWLKWGRLANFAPEDLPELEEWAVEYLMELKFDPGLLRALWESSDLPFPVESHKPHT
jgi:transposase